MTEAERNLLLLMAKSIYGSLDTPFSRRQELRALMDKVNANVADRRDKPSE